MSEKCPWCDTVQERALFQKSDEDGAVIQTECESCKRLIKVTLKVVESYVVAFPDEIQNGLMTVGRRVRKNPRWNWCICRVVGRHRKSFKCQCKTGVFEVMESKETPIAGSGFLVTVRGKSGLLGPVDLGYFLPVDEEVSHVQTHESKHR